jgi:hypothetical protein
MTRFTEDLVAAGKAAASLATIIVAVNRRCRDDAR